MNRARFRRSPLVLMALVLVVGLVAASCGDADDGGDGASGGGTLTLYSGRGEDLVEPVLAAFEAATGIDVEVRYGDSADLALLLAEEGDRTPADVFLSQSPGAVGFLAGKDLLADIDGDVLGLVDERFRNQDGRWVGVTGRVRTLVYNTDLVAAADLPDSIFDVTDPAIASQLGVAPTNGSFQDFVTAMRQLRGDDETLAWLEALAAADAPTYAKNTPIVEAVGRGEIPYGLVNHYYAYILKAEQPDLPVENHIFPDGDLGSLLLATSASVLEASDNRDVANQFIEFLLGAEAQQIFAADEYEYPLAAGVEPVVDLPPLAELELPAYDLDDLGGGLSRTQELIDQSGIAGT